MAKMNPVVLYGAWYVGDVVAELVQLLGLPLAGFVDPQPAPWNTSLHRVLDDAVVHVSIGDPGVRANVSARLREHHRHFVSLFHPTAVVSPSAKMGDGIYLAEHATVRTGASLGSGVQLQAGAIVSHHCVIADFVSVGVGSTIASRCEVGTGTLIGAGAVLRPGVAVGKNCTVGAGAVVVKDVSDGLTVAGNPARPIDPNPDPVVQSDWQ